MKNEIIYKEDAIEAVCDNCPISFKDKCEWKDNGHCSMKVALETLPSVDTIGDLVSRQWLLDLYATPEDGDDVEWKVPLEVVRQNILDAPSANVVSFEDAMQIRNTILVKEYLRGRRDAEAESSIKTIQRQIDEHWYFDELPTEVVQDDKCDHCVYKWGVKGGDDE